MTWTATKTAKRKDLKSAMVYVKNTYTDGTQTTTREFGGDDLSDEKIADFAAKHIESLEKMEAAFDAIAIDEPVTPKKIEADPLVLAYENAVRDLQKIEREVVSKIIPADDPSYLAALDAAKAAKAALEQK